MISAAACTAGTVDDPSETQSTSAAATTEASQTSESTTSVGSSTADGGTETATGAPQDLPDVVFNAAELDPSSLVGIHIASQERLAYAEYSTKRSHAVAFSADGEELAVYADLDGVLDRVAADHSGSVQLATLDSLGFSITRMAWSPTGERLAATVTPVEAEQYLESLALIDPSDGTASTIVESAPGVSLGRLVWAPSGMMIAATRSEGAERDVMIYDLETSTMSLIDPTPSLELDPAWSPDATQLAFGSDRDGECRLYLHDLKTAKTTALSDSWGPECRPNTTWSPVSGLVAFSRENPREIRVVTPGVDDEVLVTEPTFPILDLQWSPSGEVVAYTEAGDPESFVSLIGVDGTPSMFLGTGHGPSWRPTSTW